MFDIQDMAGLWVKHEDMHPATNIWGRRFWAPTEDGVGIEGTWRGIFPTRDGTTPRGLFWHFETVQPNV